MRIQETSNIPVDTPRVTHADDRRGEGNAALSFQRHVSDVKNTEYGAYIQNLTEEIFKQGEKLTKKVDVAEFQKYRALITELFNETASNSYAFSKSNAFDQRGRHKVVTVVRTVNKKLDEIAAMVLEKEADNIGLVHAVDDIRGILVDMFL